MKSLGVALLLAGAPLLAQSWQPQIGAVWSQPQGDLKQVSDGHAWGLMLGAQAYETPQGALRLFVEYRRFKTAADQSYSLSDGGFLLTGSISGPLYGFLGATAERVHLPDLDAATKLGLRGGLGWTLGRHASLEGTYTHTAMDHRSLDSVEASLILSF
ncbi:MAG: hypothetical protein JST05_05645 [Acidobacteria bacterium]|nr:hypothetical protein [Acidobacteriota bacterium]